MSVAYDSAVKTRLSKSEVEAEEENLRLRHRHYRLILRIPPASDSDNLVFTKRRTGSDSIGSESDSFTSINRARLDDSME